MTKQNENENENNAKLQLATKPAAPSQPHKTARERQAAARQQSSVRERRPNASQSRPCSALSGRLLQRAESRRLRAASRRHLWALGEELGVRRSRRKSGVRFVGPRGKLTPPKGALAGGHFFPPASNNHSSWAFFLLLQFALDLSGKL